MNNPWIKWLAALVWFAVAAQFFLMLQNRTTDIGSTIIRFFSFFTILTNTLVALYFTVMAWKKNKKNTDHFFSQPGRLTAITVYIMVVGLVYQLVLRGIWNPEGLQWLVDELLHSINPLLVLAFWIYSENKKKLHWRMLPYWLIYPALYITIILILGGITGFYPYPFVNVEELGIGKVVLNSFYVMCLILFLSSSLLVTGKYLVKTKSY
ncbi:Pr6Pr family membrane protein [Cyclobacterium plantarum]|uniref:Pr6Pr family membrane protein n=1 Tax=Cyclobacterium plantarum TaxID=2716263 RepID=UPI003F700F3A